MTKLLKKVITFMLTLAMVFSIQLTVSAAPKTAKSNTDVPNPLEELFKKLGVEDLDGVEFETLPSNNTLVKIADEDGTAAMLMANGGPLTFEDFKAAGDLSKKVGMLFVIVPKQNEGEISAETFGYLKDTGLSLSMVVSDNILEIENEKDMENFKIHYIWMIETVKKAVPLNPVIHMNPKGYDDILKKVNGKGVIAHFENEGELPGDAEIIAMYNGKSVDFSEDSEEFALYYINKETGKLDFVNKDAMLTEDSAWFEISHTSDYLITEVSDKTGDKTTDKTDKEKNNVKKAPPTGDSSMASVYTVLAAASVLTLMSARRKRSA